MSLQEKIDYILHNTPANTLIVAIEKRFKEGRLLEEDAKTVERVYEIYVEASHSAIQGLSHGNDIDVAPV